MEAWFFLLAVVVVTSALMLVRARRRMVARMALGIYGLSLALTLALLSMPLVALMAAVLGVGMALVSALARREDGPTAALTETPLTSWPMAREVALLCLVLLFWWWLRRPTFVEGLVEAETGVRATGIEVLALLYTRYAGAVSGVGLMLLAAVLGIEGREGDA